MILAAACALPQKYDSPDRLIDSSSLSGGTRLITFDSALGGLQMIGMFVPVGWAHDPEGQEGLAHLVEHLVMGGDRDSHELKSSAAIRAAGGWRNAYTYPDFTVYAELVPAEDLGSSLRRLRKRLRVFSPTPDMLETSRRIVLRELNLKRKDASPGQKIMIELQHVLLEGSPYEEDGLGQDQTLHAIELDDALSFHERHYRSAIPTVVVAGAMSHSQVEAIAQPVFRDLVADPREEAVSVDAVRVPDERSRSLRALTAFPLRIAGTVVLRPSVETRLDLAAATWAMCGKTTAQLSSLAGRSGIRSVGCGVIDFREAAIVYVLMESHGRTVEEDGWRRVLATFSRLFTTPLELDAFEGFMSRGHGSDGWASLDPWSRLLLVGSADIVAGSWDRRIRFGNLPPNLPARVQETASTLLQPAGDWPTIDLLPTEPEFAATSDSVTGPDH